MFVIRKSLISLLLVISLIPVTHANPIVPEFNGGGWVLIADDLATDGVVTTPGAGGQDFDAEYLFAKHTGNILYIGLQTGFDVYNDGHVLYGNRDYYAGDIALSFDGYADTTSGNPALMAASYEYGIDLGFVTRDYSGNCVEMDANNDCQDAAGFYSATTWNTDMVNSYEDDSSPFALDEGSYISSFVDSNSGYDNTLDTFYTWAAIDITGLGTDIDIHWTMSCGNDEINGSYTVPEPMTLSLLGLGLLSLGFARRRK